MSCRTITEDEFTQEVINSDVPVLVDFFASWCGPCRAMFPRMDELAESADGYKAFKVDTDKAKNLTNIYEIGSLPTLVIFRNGQPDERFVGVQSVSKLKAALTK